MEDDHQDNRSEFTELARAVRELSFRVQQLERRLDELVTTSTTGYTRDRSDSESSIVRRNIGLESKIGSQWLNRIGVVAVLFGVAYLLRYAFVSQWISAAAWIWLGVCGGLLIIVASEAFRRRGYRILSISLKSTGLGVSYLSLWAGLELYRLLSGGQTFSGVLLLTVLSVTLAVRESAEALSALALICAFLTPLLISIPSHEITLFLYIAILDISTSALVLKQDWRKLLAVSFFGTTVLCSVWYFGHYVQAELAMAATAATFYFAIFCSTVVLARRRLSRRGASPLLMFIEVGSPILYLGSLYLLVSRVPHHWLAAPALVLSGLYIGFAFEEARTPGFAVDSLVGIHATLGIACLAATLAFLLPADWLSLGWFAEAAVIVSVGFWRDLSWLRAGALLLLCGAVVKAFLYDVWQLALGYRTLSFIGLGILLLGISFAYQRYGFSIITNTEKDRPHGLP